MMPDCFPLPEFFSGLGQTYSEANGWIPSLSCMISGPILGYSNR